MKRGTKIVTLTEYSETGVIMRPAKTLPGWYLVRFDRDGARLTVHGDMMAVRNA